MAEVCPLLGGLGDLPWSVAEEVFITRCDVYDTGRLSCDAQVYRGAGFGSSIVPDFRSEIIRLQLNSKVSLSGGGLTSITLAGKEVNGKIARVKTYVTGNRWKASHFQQSVPRDIKMSAIGKFSNSKLTRGKKAQ